MEKHNILPHKPENAQQMHIYEEEGHWYAHGHSAYLMRQLQKGNVKIKLFVNNTCGVATDKVEVNFKTVVEKFTIVLCSDTKITFQCPN